MRIIFVAVIFYCALPARSRWIQILGEKYWERTLIAEMNMTPPTGLLYGRQESLVFFDNRVLRYKSEDYSSYEVVKSREERPPQILQDKERNALLLHGHNVFFLYKKIPPVQVVANGDPYFFEATVDPEVGIAYLIGAKNGRFGKLYAFNTFRPDFTDGRLLINSVAQLNRRFVAISVDRGTGDIALIEKDYKTGWRLVLLVADRGGSRAESPTTSDVSAERRDEGVVVTSQFRESFVAALTNMTEEFASRCVKRSNSRVVALSRENLVLRRENRLLRRNLEYFLKTSNVFFEVPEVPYFPSFGSEDRLKMEFSTSVGESAKKIMNLLSGQKVLWLDENQCQANCEKRCVDGSAGVEKKHCGTVTADSMNASLPWVVTILSATKDQSEEFYTVCYGTLIHPRVIFTSGRNCSELNNRTAIVQAGNFYLDENNRTILQERRITKSLPGSQLTDIRDVTALLILDEEFDDFNVGVSCMPKYKDAERQPYGCRALTKHYLDNGEATYSVKPFDFSKMKQCSPMTVNLLPGSLENYYCSGGSGNVSECKQMASLMVFCPALEYPNSFAMEAVLVKKFLGRCGEIFLDFANGLPWIRKTLGDLNITLEL